MGRILVMGGASLLGSHLCERLLDEGHEVIAIDDFSSGSFATLAHLKHDASFAFIEHDVTAKFEAHVDAIFHLAVPSSRRACESDPVRATVTSVMGTVHALEVAAGHGARVVVATSPERWGQGVRCAESLAIDFARTRAVDVRIVRVASAYGPRMSLDDPHIVQRLALQALRGEELELDLEVDGQADANERLSYVDDAVDTLTRTMNLERRVPAVESPFVDASHREIAQAVLEAACVDPNGEVVTSTRPSGTRLCAPPSSRGTTPDALPASILFGQPGALDLREGISRTVRWLEERLGSREAPRTSGIYGPAPVRLDVG